LNDPFVRREALALANRLLGRGDCDDVERVNLAYRLTLGRTATSWELERVLRYVADYEGVARQILAQPANPSGSEVVVAVAETGDAAVAAGSEATTKKKPAPKNPDEADQSDEPAVEEVIQPASSQAAAWASFCQALLGSAEFRYLQ
jgi:hypothetical protein